MTEKTIKTARNYASTRSSMQQVVLFQGLTSSDFDQLERLFYTQIVQPKVDIIQLDQPNTQIFFLISGSVKLYLARENQREVVLGLLGPGEMLGDVSAVDASSASASVRTLEESFFLTIHRESFESCLREVPQVALNLIRIQNSRLRRLTAHTEALASLDIDARVVRQLLLFAANYGRAFDEKTASSTKAEGPDRKRRAVRIPLRLTQPDIAALCGASLKQVNRVMKRLQEQRLVQIEAGSIIILLAPLAQQCEVFSSFF